MLFRSLVPIIGTAIAVIPSVTSELEIANPFFLKNNIKVLNENSSELDEL